MSDIAVMVMDPGGSRFAQLVDDRLPVRALIPRLVRRLGLPEELNYLLVPAGESHGLQADRSLAQSGVEPGARLRLVPARDTVFDEVMKELYEEARKYAKKKLWKYARRRLELIFRAEPDYPDPAGLARAIPDGPPASAPAGRGAPASRPQTAAEPAQSSGGAGCLVALVVAAALAAAAHWKPWEKIELPARPGAAGASAGAKDAPKADPYGVFVGGGYDEVIVARLSDIMDAPTPRLVGWGLDNTKKVKDTGAKFRMVLGPFATADEARRAYEQDRVAGTERELPVAGGTVARFRFDGKDHHVDNATRLLR